MDTRTGEIVDYSSVENMPESERKYFVPFKRDLTARETLNLMVKKYAPCACGSGKKFKFCCFKK